MTRFNSDESEKDTKKRKKKREQKKKQNVVDVGAVLDYVADMKVKTYQSVSFISVWETVLF